MQIIIDTREQKPLSFPGYDKIYRKLDEGDYNIAELEDHIVIERKSITDFYGSIIQDHARFKKEILRSKEKNKKFYIFLEGSISDVLDYCRERELNPRTMGKILITMAKRYNILIIECETRVLMSKQIVKTIEKELKTRR